MRKLLYGYLLLLLTACQTSKVIPVTPTEQTFVDNQSITEPAVMPTSTATAVHTITSTATQTPSLTPSSTPLPHPFELDIVGELIAYPLPIIQQRDMAVYIQDSRLMVANIADPALPIAIWESEFLGDVLNAKADKNHLYVWLDDELQIWNITDLREPMQMAGFPFEIVQEGFRKEIIVDADNLYLVQVILEDALLTVFDVALPESPKLLGTSEFVMPAFHQFLIFDGLLFVIDDGKVDVYDISDPLRANIVGKINLPTNVNSSLSLQEDLLFVATYSKLFILLDTSSAPLPTQVFEYADWQINQMVISNQTAFLYSEICGWEPRDDGMVGGGCGYVIDVVDISTPSELVSKGFVRLYLGENQAFVQRIRLLDTSLYFELSDGNVYIVDVNQFGE